MIQAAAIALALALAWGGLQTWRLGSCQAEVAAAQQTIGRLGGEIEAQNAAVAKLASDGAAKAQEAAKALRAAEARARTWAEDSARWRKALEGRKPDGPQDCKAAWQEIRGK